MADSSTSSHCRPDLAQLISAGHNPVDHDDAIPPTPPSPSAYSSFSMTSTLEARVFRGALPVSLNSLLTIVDDGRIYQAANDDYALPADHAEQARLNNQHYGIKTIQGGKNYVGPVDVALPNQGEGKRAIDIGTGTGIWYEQPATPPGGGPERPLHSCDVRIQEMAQEFPKAEWIEGVDLVPVQNDDDMPNNVHYVKDDVTKGLAFPDESFDFVHGRFLLLGVRDWGFVIKEAIRILRPGGLLLWVDITLPWPITGVTEEEAQAIAPGYTRMLRAVTQATQQRGLDIDAGLKAGMHMRNSPALQDMHQVNINVPMWPWSDEPAMKKAGNIMVHDTKELPQSARLLIVDGCQISDEEYQELVDGYMSDIGRPGAHMVLPTWHNWAVKKM